MTHTDAWGYKLLSLRNGREWELIEDYTYERGPILIMVSRGFVYDGASIPRVFWRFIGPPAAGKYAHASLLHDWLYVHQRWLCGDGELVKITRKEADDLMLVVMKEDGVSWWRRNAIHRAVRLGGGRAWRT